jgi:3-oxoacyl-(acyl-carrier-protein) synthase III
MSITAVIRATGGYLPKKIVTNADLEKLVDTSDEWIVKRTGIRERRLAEAHETTGTMAIEAGKQALANAKLEGKDIDTVIVATTTPDKKFPAVAVNVQQALGIPPGPAFDVQAVCTGFVYALGIANSFIQTGISKRVLVIGAEKMSSIVDWNDRATCVLFADGAGAAILEVNTKNDGRGVISTHLYADGRFQDLLYRRSVDRHGRARGVQERRPVHGRCGGRSSGEEQTEGGRYKFTGTAPGEYPHYRGDGQEAEPVDGQGCDDGGAPWQYVGGVDPAGAA